MDGRKSLLLCGCEQGNHQCTLKSILSFQVTRLSAGKNACDWSTPYSLTHITTSTCTITISPNNLLRLVDDLLDNLLHGLLLPLGHLLARALLLEPQPRRIDVLLAHALLLGQLLAQHVRDPRAPREPLVQQAAAVLDDGAVGLAAPDEVLLVEDAVVLAQVLADLLLLLLGEQRRRARPPGQLLEPLDGFFAQDGAAEVVEVVAVFGLGKGAAC